MSSIPEHRYLSLRDLASFLYSLGLGTGTPCHIPEGVSLLAGAVEVNEIHVLQHAIEHVLGHVLEKDGSVVVSGPTSQSFDEQFLE